MATEEEDLTTPAIRQELTTKISVMDRPLRLDEVAFECFSGGQTGFPAVVLTDYAEVRTENGKVGGQAGSYVVDGPSGLEVLSPVEFGQKFTFEAGVDPNAAPVDEGFVQDLDAARQDEDPATAEKGVTVPGDTPGDQVDTNPVPEVEGSDDGSSEFEDEVKVEESAEEDDAETSSDTEEDEADETPADDPPEGDEEAVVSQFDSLEDNALWEVANDLEINIETSVSRAELIALIVAAVAEAENAPESTE